MSRRQVVLDPAVAAILGDQARRRERRTPAGKRKAERESKRVAVNLRLDAGLVGIIRETAAALGISPAGLVDVMVAHGLIAWTGGAFELAPFLRASRSPRYEWVVELGGVTTLAAEVRDHLARYGEAGGDQ